MTTDFGDEPEQWPQLAERLRMLRRAQLRLRTLLEATGSELTEHNADETETAGEIDD